MTTKRKQSDIDREFGLKSERELKDIIGAFLGTKLEKLDYFNAFDYIGDNVVVELKTRRNKKNTYPTTLVGANKIIEGKAHINNGYRVFYMFRFTDGIYFIEQNDIDFDDIRPFTRSRDNRAETKDYCYINIKNLLPIN
tara:strand:- start:913 stop:1329 length:417 start_codon:yes stop_codon:yes gene_type:complete